MKVFDERFEGLEKAMDLYFKRHVLLSGNLANSDTPQYRARELDFAGSLARAFGSETGDLKKTSPGHLDIGDRTGERVVLDNSAAMGADGNNVDLDLITGKISDNARAYESAANLIGQKRQTKCQHDLDKLMRRENVNV